MKTLMKNVSGKKEKFHVPGEKTDGGMKRKYSRLERKKIKTKQRKYRLSDYYDIIKVFINT